MQLTTWGPRESCNGSPCVMCTAQQTCPTSGPLHLQFPLPGAGIVTIFCKGPEGTYFRLCKPYGLSQQLNSALTAKSSHRQCTMNGRGCEPINLYLQKHVVGCIWPVSYSWPTPESCMAPSFAFFSPLLRCPPYLNSSMPAILCSLIFLYFPSHYMFIYLLVHHLTPLLGM